LVGIVVVCLGALLLTLISGWKPNLGLDLQGGVSVVLKPVQRGTTKQTFSADKLEQTKDIIEKRVNGIGVAEPDVSVQGQTIVIAIPGLKNQKGVLDLVGKTAELRFRPVLEQPTGAPPANAESKIATLRKKLNIPDGVTAQQIYDDELAKSSTTTATGADGQPIAVTPDASTTTAVAAETPTTTAANGEGTGGKSSAKVGHFRDQDTTTTTAAATTTAADATTTTVAGGTTTTTVFVPKNQWSVDVSSKDFAELFQLEAAVTASKAEVTKAEDDLEKKEVTLYGKADKDGNRLKYKLGATLLKGKAIKDASASLNQQGAWVVNPVFKDGADGIDLFNAAAAQCNSGTSDVCPGLFPSSETGGKVGALAVVLDGEVISAPAINAASFSADRVEISGMNDQEEANDLALALKYGSLPVELEPQQLQTVSATLGSGALHAGLIAGLVGLGLVALYIIAYYRLLGVVTLASLLLSSALMYSIISYFGAKQGLALTLSGIVGIIVSVGVSLDSSVVYFENLKEDVRNGSTLRSTVDRSFTDAYSTIVKADSSSLIGAAILYFLSVGPVKGFAFYLALSTLLDLIMAYFFIRPATAALARSSLNQKPTLFGIPVDRPAASVPKPQEEANEGEVG
jgi:preprotein translocase subunit SecD